jgi:hypothetical protein
MNKKENSKTARLLTHALVIQIALAVFCPPIPVIGRLFFISDLWVFLWTPLFAVFAYREAASSTRRTFGVSVLGVFLIFLVVYLHGMIRPGLTPELAFLLGGSKDEVFNFGKEGFVALRFFVWIVAAIAVSRVQVDQNRIKRSLALITGIAAFSVVAAALFPTVALKLGELYHYIPSASPWANRHYGVFRSPIEGCLFLSFSILLLIPGSWAKPRLKVGALILIGSALVLTKTLSGILGLLAAALYALAQSHPPRKIKTFLVGKTLILSSLLYYAWNSPFLASKRENFLFRLKPWMLYWETLTARIDTFLFGTGFHSYFSDDIYLFFFSRGGILLLGTACIFGVMWWKRTGRNLGPWSKAIPIFFLVSGLVVDNLILRPVAYLFIACAIRALQGSSKTSQA